MRVHCIAYTEREDAMAAARSVAEWLTERGVEVAAEPDVAKLIGVEALSESQYAKCDLMVTFGGDGTLIRGVYYCSEFGTPILGVYYGRFGFVTQCMGHDAIGALQLFMDGKAVFDERTMLETELWRAGRSLISVHSLNESVLQRTVTSRMLTFDISVDGCFLTRYPADGVIVATSTGSTAYNLSAGGPIMDPRVQGFIVTPIAPHTLMSRSLVIAPDSEIHIQIEADGEAVLSADGMYRLHVLSQDELRVRRSPRVTRLVCVKPDNFLGKLGDRIYSLARATRGTP